MLREGVSGTRPRRFILTWDAAVRLPWHVLARNLVGALWISAMSQLLVPAAFGVT